MVEARSYNPSVFALLCILRPAAVGLLRNTRNARLSGVGAAVRRARCDLAPPLFTESLDGTAHLLTENDRPL